MTRSRRIDRASLVTPPLASTSVARHGGGSRRRARRGWCAWRCERGCEAISRNQIRRPDTRSPRDHGARLPAHPRQTQREDRRSHRQDEWSARHSGFDRLSLAHVTNGTLAAGGMRIRATRRTPVLLSMGPGVGDTQARLPCATHRFGRRDIARPRGVLRSAFEDREPRWAGEQDLLPGRPARRCAHRRRGIRPERPARSTAAARLLCTDRKQSRDLSVSLGFRRLSRTRCGRRASVYLLRRVRPHSPAPARLPAPGTTGPLLGRFVLHRAPVSDLDRRRRGVDEPGRPHSNRRDGAAIDARLPTRQRHRSSPTATTTASTPTRRCRRSSAND